MRRITRIYTHAHAAAEAAALTKIDTAAVLDLNRAAAVAPLAPRNGTRVPIEAYRAGHLLTAKQGHASDHPPCGVRPTLFGGRSPRGDVQRGASIHKAVPSNGEAAVTPRSSTVRDIARRVVNGGVDNAGVWRG